MLGSKANILVKVYAVNLREGQFTLIAPFNQLLICTHGSGARCQTQHTVGLILNLRRNDFSGLTAHTFIIFCLINFHDIAPLIRHSPCP